MSRTVTSTCRNCGRVFEHRSCEQRTFCSLNCLHKWNTGRPRGGKRRPRNPRLLKTCAICGKAFAALPGKTTCSRRCAAILRKRERLPRLDPEAEALHAYVAKHYPSY